MYPLYRSASWLLAPVMPLWLKRRQGRGKEDQSRIRERFGRAGRLRPNGKLLWVHAASVGEANAALPLIETLLAEIPTLHVLLTTGTVTSASLMTRRLPARALHQFVPVDTPLAVRRFMKFWKPDVGLFIDSELWPNLIHEAEQSRVVLAMANARMSERSFKSWKRYAPWLIRPLLNSFFFCFAQSDQDAKRLQTLGISRIHAIGNLKYDVPALECDERELVQLQQAIGNRPVWLAASTHAGEEVLIAAAHRELQQYLPDLLTIIVPRHATRATDVLQDLPDLYVSQRSCGQAIHPATEIYLADTMGELGLFYRLADVALIGGSLIPHGGQNPIEAMKLGCPVIMGPHMENFASVVAAMQQAGIGRQLQAGASLAAAVYDSLKHPDWLLEQSQKSLQHVTSQAGCLDAICDALSPILAQQQESV